MAHNMPKTSGSLFVQHFIFGITSIALVVSAIKFLGIFGSNQYTPLLTAALIALANLITIGNFTFKVINNEQMLAEDDSPDHAYYLGFCLTLASLAIIFFSDAMQNISIDGSESLAARMKSDMLRGALTQFAAGLLATLLGLCARIYIASLQNTSKQEPTELINQLRQEIFSFSSSLTESRKVHDDTITKSIRSLQSSLAKMENGAETLATIFEESATVLNESLSSKEIGAQAVKFIDTLKSLSLETKTQSDSFVDNLKQLNSASSSLGDDLAKTTTKLNEVNNSAESFSKALLKISTEDLPRVSQSSVELISGIKKAEHSIHEAASIAAVKANDLSTSISLVKGSIESLNTEFKVPEIKQLRDDVNGLSKNISKLTNDISELSLKITEQAKKDQGVISRWF
jgi:uncharacterized coiled-coil DUF342 family protein